MVDYQISVIRATLQPSTAGSRRLELSIEDAKASQIRPNAVVYITDLSLIEFRQILLDNSIPCQLERGVLSCGTDGSVKVIKSGSQFHLLGSFSQAYLKVRNLLIKQFRVI